MGTPQLVGQNCVSCGKTISSVADSRFCQVCGNPVHLRCQCTENTGIRDGKCTCCGGNPLNDIAIEVINDRKLADGLDASIQHPAEMTSTWASVINLAGYLGTGAIWILMIPIVLIVICLFSVLIGDAVGGAFHLIVCRSTEGTVESTETYVTHPRPTTTSHHSVVWYRYKVGDKLYRSKRVFPYDEMTGFDKQGAESVLARFPVGASCRVYYDPFNEEYAFLEYNLPLSYFCVLFTLAVSFWMAFTWMYRIVWRATGSRTKDAVP
jgi:hypothetical protein